MVLINSRLYQLMAICFALSIPSRQGFSFLNKTIQSSRRGFSKTKMMSTMSEKDKYLFDLNGYIVIRGVLTAAEIEHANSVIDRKQDKAQERIAAELRNTRKDSPLSGDGMNGRKDLGGLLEWGEDSDVFKKMLAHPTVIPYFHELIGKGYRMDHLPFLVLSEKGAEGFSLHGGTVDVSSGEYNANLAYSCVNKKISNQLLAMSVVLSDHNEGDGGFIVVRGSHKSTFPAPQDMVN
jgi:ectoine hydroxylase-related dioxygenase (phytanoyl-CoA dioxygenase family)